MSIPEQQHLKCSIASQQNKDQFSQGKLCESPSLPNFSRRDESENAHKEHCQFDSMNFQKQVEPRQNSQMNHKFRYCSDQEPTTLVKSRLQHDINLDKVYNSRPEAGYVSEPVSHHPFNRARYNLASQSVHFKGTEQQSQPFGSGVYTNQLSLRSVYSKSGVNFYNTKESQKKKSKCSHLSSLMTNCSSNFSTLTKSKQVQESLRQKLYFDERTKTVPKTTIKNTIIEDIVSEGDVFIGNKQLMQSIYQLKRLNLLKQHESHVNNYNQRGKFPYVFNDYHSKSTNNGFSRQEKGGFFFTK